MRSNFYLHDLESGRVLKILENIKGIFCPFFVGGRLLAFTDLQAPNRRIVAIDLRVFWAFFSEKHRLKDIPKMGTCFDVDAGLPPWLNRR